MRKTIWRDITNIEGGYQVSNDRNIRTIAGEMIPVRRATSPNKMQYSYVNIDGVTYSVDKFFEEFILGYRKPPKIRNKEWRLIPGHNNMYEISDKMVIRRVSNRRIVKERLIKDDFVVVLCGKVRIPKRLYDETFID
jgi:hypothetical protein